MKISYKILKRKQKKELVNLHAEARWALFFLDIVVQQALLHYSSTTCTMDANVILRPLWIILLKRFNTK